MPLDPIGRIVQNLVLLERLSNTIGQDSIRLERALIDQIIHDLERIDPTEPLRIRYRRGRTKRLIEQIRARVREFVPTLDKQIRDGLVQIGRDQALWAEDVLKVTLGAASENVAHTQITQQRLRAILNTDPFEGRVLKDHVRRIGSNIADRVTVQIRIGMAAEESIPDIVRRIRGRRARGGFEGGVLQRSTRETEALVRTAVTHVSNEGMRGTFRENEDILAGVRFVATLDGRTTPVCMSFDGEVWPLGSPKIQTPPLHWNCRSILAPEVDWEGLGLPEPPESLRSARDPVTGKVTKIPGDITYEQWLRSQPASVQAEILGVGKARLFRKGEITLADLVRSDRTVVPLKELQGAA